MKEFRDKTFEDVKNDSNLINKWVERGFLKENQPNSLTLARVYDIAFIEIVKNEVIYNDKTKTLVFTSFKKIFDEIKIENFDKLVSEVIAIIIEFNKYSYSIEDIHGPSYMDIECEYMDLFCKTYIGKYKTNND